MQKVVPKKPSNWGHPAVKVKRTRHTIMMLQPTKHNLVGENHPAVHLPYGEEIHEIEEDTITECTQDMSTPSSIAGLTEMSVD